MDSDVGGKRLDRKTLEKDLRVVDEIVCKSGDELRILDVDGVQNKTALLRMIYWLAVAVWHLLDIEIKRKGHNG